MYKIENFAKENKRIKIATKIINIAVYIILIPIITFNLILIIKSIINPDKIPEIFGIKNFIIVSGSMEPEIMIGDAIFIKEVDEEEIKENDIISFKQNNEITTHRVIDITEENGTKYYTTKGDSNEIEDREKITYKQIEGKFLFKSSKYGAVIEILQNKVILVVLIILFILNYLYSIHIDDKKERRKEKRENLKRNEI